MQDHTYIDDNAVAERYLRHSLKPDERREFEEHLVDCEECADRLLLAEMFLNRNGGVRRTYPTPTVVEKPATEAAPFSPKPGPREPEPLLFQHLVRPPVRGPIASQLSPWLVTYIVLIIVLILLSLPPVAIFVQEQILHQ